MILKGLPETHKPFAIYTTQSSEEITFTQFKSNLQSYEETEKYDNNPKSDNMMKVDVPSITCYRCGQQGHVVRDRWQKGEPKWCSYYSSSTHSDAQQSAKKRDDHKRNNLCV